MANLIIDKKYFRDKTKNKVLPEDLDSQFNLIATYINNDLIPYIESIITTATNGIAGQPSSVFCNINNNEVGYMYIEDINIDDNLLSLNKIVKIPTGSILASDYQGEIFAVTPTDNDQLLFSDFLSSMSFRKITSDDIGNNLLTGKQLGVLANENFAAGTFADIIWDDSIYEHMLQDISNEKIALTSIDFKHIGEFKNLGYSSYVAGQVLLDDFDDKSITNTKVKNNSITPANFIDPQFIEGKNIFPGSITDSHLKAYNANTQAPRVINLPSLIGSNFGAIINFPGQGIKIHNIKLPKEKIALNSLTINSFNQEIRTVINKYKQIKEKATQPPVQTKKTRPDNFVKLGQFFLDQNIQKRYEQNGSQVRTHYIYVGVATYPSGYLIYTNQQNIAGWMYNGDDVRFLYYNNQKKNLERLQSGPDWATDLPISAFTGAAQAVSKYSKRASKVEFYNFPF